MFQIKKKSTPHTQSVFKVHVYIGVLSLEAERAQISLSKKLQTDCSLN